MEKRLEIVKCLTCGKVPYVREGYLIKEPYTTARVQCRKEGCWTGALHKGDGCVLAAVTVWNSVMTRE